MILAYRDTASMAEEEEQEEEVIARGSIWCVGGNW